MTWEEYYSKFYGWATSTQIKRLPYAMLNADVNPAEIVDVARDILDEKAAGRLMKRAASAGIQFTAEQILELSQCEADEGLYMIWKLLRVLFRKRSWMIFTLKLVMTMFAERYLKLLEIRGFVCRACVMMKNQRKLHHNANIGAPVF